MARVLIAEDDDEMRSLLSQVLEADGYEVVTARNGFELYHKLQQCAGVGAWPTDETPGLAVVVSDVRMPGMTGLEVLEFVAEELPNLPFIVITAFADNATRQLAQQLRVAAFLSKPFYLDEFERAVVRAMVSGPSPRTGRERLS